MGYTTDFRGEFELNKPLDTETLNFLVKFNETRRMKRNVKGYGVEGEFFVDGTGSYGQDSDSTVIDHNAPPKTQPGLWCGWRPNDEGTAIVWDEGEKFYDYVEWLQYLIDNILSPKGYTLTGDVTYSGEDHGDIGVISVKNSKVKVYHGTVKAPKPKKSKPKVKASEIAVQLVSHKVNGKCYLESESVIELVKAIDKAKLSPAKVSEWIRTIAARN